MNNTRLYNKLLSRLEDNLELLPDKPEETYEASLKALWQKAFGNAVSVERALRTDLPDLNGKQVEFLEELIEKRISGVPVAYITGRQQFMGVELIVNPKALIPRKETEILGNLALKLLKERVELTGKVATVFDVCCGAGNLAIAMGINEPLAHIFAADLSEEAVDVAKENVKLHKLENKISVFQGDLLSPFESDVYYNKVDLIICNPPYISDFKVPKMAPEIAAYEPEMAFKGGGLLGMNIVRNLIENAARFLDTSGTLIFEIGLGQGEYVMNLCNKTGLYREIISATDSNGNIRVVGVVK